MHGVFKRQRANTLFAKRPLVNAADFVKWAKDNGFKTTQDPKDLHITLAYSKTPLQWPAPSGGKITVPGTSAGRSVQPLGDKGAVVLKFTSPELTKRWQELKDAGAVWDYEGFQPHVTISWKSDDVDLSKIKPYAGPLVFGPEVFKSVDVDWEPKVEKGIAILKQDAAQQIAWGWASVAALNGEPVVDLQKDIIDGEEMMRATTEFMEDVRRLQSMHKGDQIGVVVHSLPLTTELAKAFGLNTDREGWIVGVKIKDPEVWKRVADGELRAFSIGGSGERELIKRRPLGGKDDEEMEDDCLDDDEDEDKDLVVDSKVFDKMRLQLAKLQVRTSSLLLKAGKGNPYHKPKGSGGGQFTSGSGVEVGNSAPGKTPDGLTVDSDYFDLMREYRATVKGAPGFARGGPLGNSSLHDLTMGELADNSPNAVKAKQDLIRRILRAHRRSVSKQCDDALAVVHAALEKASVFDEAKHPRVSRGSDGGGRFAHAAGHQLAHVTGHVAGHTAGHLTREALTPEEKKHRRSRKGH